MSTDPDFSYLYICEHLMCVKNVPSVPKAIIIFHEHMRSLKRNSRKAFLSYFFSLGMFFSALQPMQRLSGISEIMSTVSSLQCLYPFCHLLDDVDMQLFILIK